MEVLKKAKVQSAPYERAVGIGERSLRRGTWICVEYIVGQRFRQLWRNGGHGSPISIGDSRRQKSVTMRFVMKWNRQKENVAVTESAWIVECKDGRFHYFVVEVYLTS